MVLSQELSVRFSPDGCTLASQRVSDGTVKLWYAATGAGIRTMTGHGDRVSDATRPPNIRLSSSLDVSLRSID